jgi:hypothetical protein
MKIPRQCPLVLLVKVGWSQVILSEVKKVDMKGRTRREG